MSDTPSPRASPAPASRRDRNKAATRTAIADAALALLRAEGPAAVTAERLAEAAGVSRRTFFNYFPTVESALNEPTERLLDQALARLDEVPAETPVTDAAVDVMLSLGDRRALGRLADLFAATHGASPAPALERIQLESWNRCAERVVETIAGRLPEADPLHVSVFAHAVIGAGRAVFTHWALRHAGDTSDAAVADLQRQLADAFAQLRDGFPLLHTQAASAETRKA